LICQENYYVEKLNCFFLYQFWGKGKNLIEAAHEIASSFASDKYNDNHFKSDMIDQIRRETDTKQLYVGLETFATMTSGLPRYLLI
jgi:hypothetical protein